MNTKHVVIGATALIIITASLLLVGFLQTPASTPALSDSHATATTTAQPTRDPDTSAWTRYQNTAFHFALRYPAELSVQEYPETDGAMSATFRNAASGKGFQVYAAPYEHAAITKDRLKLDLPSGVMDNAGDVFVDGVRARSFFSTNTQMGGTYEVWVINDGFLFEVVTHDVSARWLDSILQTWQFI